MTGERERDLSFLGEGAGGGKGGHTYEELKEGQLRRRRDYFFFFSNPTLPPYAREVIQYDKKIGSGEGREGRGEERAFFGMRDDK